MPFDFLDDLFDHDRRERRGRRSGIGGLLDRLLGGDRDRRRDDNRDAEGRVHYQRRDHDDDDDRREYRERDRRRDDRGDDWEYERRRRHGRDNDLFDFD